MEVVVFLAQKGGVGRSSLTESFAVAAEEAGHQVLILDLDPQSTVCKWSDRRQAESPIVLDAQPARLSNALKKAEESGITMAFIDTPPRSAEAALEAAKVASVIIVPVRPQMHDLETVPNTLSLIATAATERRAEIPVIAILNAIMHQGNRHEQARSGLQAMGIRVCEQTIGQRAAFGDASALGLSVLELDKSSRASEEIRKVYSEISSVLQEPSGTAASKPRRTARGGA